MLLSQIRQSGRLTVVVARDGSEAAIVQGAASTYALANRGHRHRAQPVPR